MAKIIKKNVRWAASTSSDVTNYKVYWTLQTSAPPTYASDNVVVVAPKTNLILPDEAPSFPTATETNFVFGITAIDDVGNESDMAISSPVAIDFLAPTPPSTITVENV